MEKITQQKICQEVGIVPGFLSDILNHGKRPSWSNAKRLAHVTGSEPIQWMEASPEVLRQIVDDFKAKSVGGEK